MLPRDAFFAAKERRRRQGGRADLRRADHPYPPGIPVIIPGERITAELLDYLRSGLAAGMQLPDPADPSLATIRVVTTPRPITEVRRARRRAPDLRPLPVGRLQITAVCMLCPDRQATQSAGRQTTGSGRTITLIRIRPNPRRTAGRRAVIRGVGGPLSSLDTPY